MTASAAAAVVVVAVLARERTGCRASVAAAAPPPPAAGPTGAAAAALVKVGDVAPSVTCGSGTVTGRDTTLSRLCREMALGLTRGAAPIVMCVGLGEALVASVAAVMTASRDA